METFQSVLAKKLSDALAAAGLPDAGELRWQAIRASAITRPTLLSFSGSNAAKIHEFSRRKSSRILLLTICANHRQWRARASSTLRCDPPPSLKKQWKCCGTTRPGSLRSGEHTSELQAQSKLLC